MTAIVLLFVSGALLLTAEVFLPGAIAGIIGGCLLVLGAIVSFTTYGAGGGLVATLGAAVLVGVMLYAELVWLPRSRLGRELVVEATVGGQSQPPIASADVVGKPAVALTTLAPSGVVEIEGRRYEAYCRTGHAVRGATLQVVDVDNFRLVVSETKPS